LYSTLKSRIVVPRRSRVAHTVRGRRFEPSVEVVIALMVGALFVASMLGR
jgi:hypothetical protein